MSTVGKALSVQADYATRGRDYETELVGPVTDTIIDACRLARLEHRSGFPSYQIYRLILAGDRRYLPHVRRWWVLFAIEWCRSNMRKGYSIELATIAAWDSLQRVMDPAHPALLAQDAALSLGVELETYTRARNHLKLILDAELSAFWSVLVYAYRVVVFQGGGIMNANPSAGRGMLL